MNSEKLKIIADKQSTPAYLFDTDALTKRVRMIKDQLGSRFRICYAMKANPFLIKPLEQTVDCYEVCSPGEFRICERNAVSMERIVLSGVYKEKKDMLHAMLEYGADGIYTIESIRQLLLLEDCAKKADVKIKALIRVTSGNQFGLDEDEVRHVIASRKAYTHIEFIGLQQYTGTQKKKLSKIQAELAHLDTLIAQLKAEYDFDVKELEYGPGFFVPYFQSDEEIDDIAVLAEFRRIVEGLRYQGSITLEMGRYIAAYCGYYMTRIADMKTNRGQKYCIVDGGIHHLSYFGQAMAMKLPHYRYLKVKKGNDGGEEENYTICGSLCTVNDVIVKNLPLLNAEIDDILIFERVGAYSVTEGIYLFLSRDLPEVLLWSEAEGVQTVREKAPTDVINDGKRGVV